MTKVKERTMHIVFLVAACMSILAVAMICLFMFANGVPAIRQIGFVNFIFGKTWMPGANKFGIFPMIIGSIYVTAGAIIIGVPIGLLCAVFMAKFCPPKLHKIMKPAVDLLAGIPSIVFGLFGMMFFGNTLGLGYSLLTGALTLAIMVLPLITRNTQEALKTVPDSYRNGALGMGATKWYMIRTILLPSAMPGIVTGVILAIGRIVGESAALLFTAGSGYLLPKTSFGYLHKILESGGTLTIQLYLSMSKGQYDIAFGIAVVLLVIVLVINMITKLLAGKLDVTKKN